MQNFVSEQKPIRGEDEAIYFVREYAHVDDLPDGVPCYHFGCLNHILQPCEGCGRVGGKRKEVCEK